MDTQLILTFLILIVALILFLTDKISADLVALLVVVTLGVTGILTPAETFSGFSRTAVITIMAVFILAEGLQKTGVTEQVGNILLKVGGRTELRLLIVVMLSGAILSIFMNNIAAVAMLLPAVSGAAKKANVPVSRLLMPLAFGSIMGGMTTLLTTSNILLSSLLHDNNIPGFSLTDFLPVGIPIIICGILYVAFIGRKFLAKEAAIEKVLASNNEISPDLITTYNLSKNLFSAKVPQNSVLIDKPLSESVLRENYDVNVIAIERNSIKLLEILPETIILEGDILTLDGDLEDFCSRDVEPFLEILPKHEWREEDLESQNIEVVEAMLSPRSRLIGESLRTARFRKKYGVTVLAVWRGEKEVDENILDLQLAFGDALLLQGPRERLFGLSNDSDLILLAGVEETDITVQNKGRAALTIFVTTLICAIVFPDITGVIMLGGAIAMMLVGILNTEQAYNAIGWKSVFLVAGMLPMGIALTKTNAAGLMANQITNLLGDFGPMAFLAGLFIIAAALTQTVTGSVIAAIMGPVAIQVAQQTNTNPRALVMAVALGCSMAFITPLGHPVNILVMSPGGYKFSDFMKVGIPLAIILFFVIMFFLPIFWQI